MARAATRIIAVVLAAVALTACGGEAEDTSPAPVGEPTVEPSPDAAPDQPSATGEASLRVAIQSDGTGPADLTATITCPADHFAAQAVRDACALVESSPEVLEPYVVDPAAGACAPVPGPRPRATVTGTADGQQVDVRYSRSDACEAGHWDAAAKLFVAAGYVS